MSNPLKSVGKVFKKVAKAAKVVLPIALAVGAVVFTGGAALGVLPSFSAAIGGVVGGLGLSAGVTGALTGAITSAGFGGALGFITGGKKGLQKGALMGALTGGVLGAVNPSSFGIVKAADGSVTTMNALRHGGNAFGAGKATTEVIKNANGTFSSGLPKGIAPSAPAMPGAPADLPNVASNVRPATELVNNAPALTAPPPAAPFTPSAPVGVAPPDLANVASNARSAADMVAMPAMNSAGIAPAASKGVLGFLEKNPMLSGQILQGIGGALSGGDGDTYADKEEAERRRSEYLYGGIDRGDPFGMKGGGSLNSFQPRYYYDRDAKRVVDRQGGY